MPKKTKLKLNDLKIKSFSTTENGHVVGAGTHYEICMDPTLVPEKCPSHLCPPDSMYCPPWTGHRACGLNE